MKGPVAGEFKFMPLEQRHTKTGPDKRVVRVLQVLEAVRDSSSMAVTAVTLECLAQAVSLSPSRLEHLFKCQTGVSVRRAILDSRLEKAACILTRDPRLEIKQIAYICGYHHSSSFSRAFKARFGTSPETFRTQCRRY